MEVSKAEDFGPAEKLVTLPVPGPGGPLVLRIQAAELDELFPLLDGIPGLGTDKGKAEEMGQMLRDGKFSAALPFFHEYAEKVRPIVERYVLEPRISFEATPAAGEVRWSSLHWRNQVAIAPLISVFSQSGSAEDELASFSEERNGRRDGGGPGVAEQLAAAAAHTDSEAPGPA